MEAARRGSWNRTVPSDRWGIRRVEVSGRKRSPTTSRWRSAARVGDPQLVRVGGGAVGRQHLGEAVAEFPGGIEVEPIRGGAGNRIGQGLQLIVRQQREAMMGRGEGVEGEPGVGGWVSVGEIFLAEQFLETMEARGVGKQLDDLRRGRCGGLARGGG